MSTGDTGPPLSARRGRRDVGGVLIALLQLVETLLLKLVPAIIAFSGVSYFMESGRQLLYGNNGAAFVFLGGLWLFEGPSWRTAARSNRWRTWLGAVAFCVAVLVATVVFFEALHAEWAGLWTFLTCAVVVFLFYPDDRATATPTSPAAPPAPAPESAPLTSAATPQLRGRLGRALIVSGMVIALLAVAGASYFFALKERTSATDAFALAWNYRTGSEGVPQDLAQAAQWFERAAKAGHAAAQYDLAVLEENGLGVPVNLTRARQHYQQAASHNYAPALTRLGALELESGGDRPAAIKQLETAAWLGDPWAEYVLGSAYLARRAEEDCTACLVQALVWLERAQRHGVEPVGGLLQHIWGTVPDEELASVRDEVRRRLDEENTSP